MLTDKAKARWKLSVSREEKFGCELASGSLRSFVTTPPTAQPNPRNAAVWLEALCDSQAKQIATQFPSVGMGLPLSWERAVFPADFAPIPRWAAKPEIPKNFIFALYQQPRSWTGQINIASNTRQLSVGNYLTNATKPDVRSWLPYWLSAENKQQTESVEEESTTFVPAFAAA
jgi:hypothetical protein